MRYLILSDIHANIDALEAVLAAAPAETWDRALVLGDLVGYGAEPNAVIERVRALDPLAAIRGNHDKAACGYRRRQLVQLRRPPRGAVDASRRSPPTTASTCARCRRARRRSTTASRSATARRSTRTTTSSTPTTRAARSMRQPGRCACSATRTCRWSFDAIQALFDGFLPEGPNDSLVQIERGLNYLINVGSVGQPRDGDPRAAFGIYDSTEPSY